MPDPFLPAASRSFAGRDTDDRARLEFQFELLREDFLMWFDVALRRARLATDPNRATWSALDVGCGEGQYVQEIARRYPRATVTGVDLSADAMEAARAMSAGEPNVRFLEHDILEPIPPGIVPDGGFDMVVSWMVLHHLPAKVVALAHLAAALRPGGALLLADAADDAVRLDQPDAQRLTTVGTGATPQLGVGRLERDLAPLLRQVGFEDIESAMLRYLAGGATAHGQRWYRYALATLRAGRRPVVDLRGLMAGEEFDRHLDALHRAPVHEVSGEVRFLVTVARRR